MLFSPYNPSVSLLQQGSAELCHALSEGPRLDAVLVGSKDLILGCIRHCNSGLSQG